MYEDLSYVLKFQRYKSARKDSPQVVTEHPITYLHACNCMVSKDLVWDLLAVHTAQLYSKLGHNTAMKMCLRVPKSNAKLYKTRYKQPNFCLLFDVFIPRPITTNFYSKITIGI